MSTAPDLPGNPLSAAYLKGWEEQLGAFGELFKHFGTAALPLAPMAPPLAPVMPALGLAREHLEIAQKITELGVQLQQGYAEFMGHLSGIQQEALRAIQKPGANPSYDEWIDSAESVYATLAHGATFARLLAQLCNTFSALKVQRGKLLEYLSRQLDLPTRAEVDSLHQQVRLLRDQVRERNDT
jgi:hypothetical protein